MSSTSKVLSELCHLDFDALASDYFELGAPACMVVPVKPIEGLEGDYIFEVNNIKFEFRQKASLTLPFEFLYFFTLHIAI